MTPEGIRDGIESVPELSLATPRRVEQIPRRRPDPLGTLKGRCSSVAEQLFRKQQVVGSNPTTGSSS